MPYVGITKGVQDPKILQEVMSFVSSQQGAYRWIHVHCSTPCSSGSLLKHLNQKMEFTQADVEWAEIMRAIEPYLNAEIPGPSSFQR